MLSRCFLVAVLSLLTLPRATRAETTLFVATDGNDTWSGEIARPAPDGKDGPFASLERAQEEVRSRLRSGLDGPLVVDVGAGVYHLQKPVVFTGADSGLPGAPVIWTGTRSDSGSLRARITGAQVLDGFGPILDKEVRDRLPDMARDHVVAAPLGDAAVGVMPPEASRGFGRGSKPEAFRLYVNGQRMPLARWPNAGWARIASVSPDGARTAFHFEGERPLRWQRPETALLHGFWTWDWADSYERIANLDRQARRIETRPPHGVYGYKSGARWAALNVLEELDQPGEWVVEDDVLYFWPPVPLDGAEVTVSRATTAMIFDGAAHVRIDGFHFDQYRGTTLEIRGGAWIRVSKCQIENTGNYGVVIRDGFGHRLESCEIAHSGDGGVSVRGGDRKALRHSGHEVVGNDIHDFGEWVVTYTPGVQVGGVGARVAHNAIHDGPHAGILLGGNEHRIEYNRVARVCRATDDAGAFYMGRDWSAQGNVIRYNSFHDIGGINSLHGTSAIYLDDFASGVQVYGNLVHGARRGLLLGGGRSNRIENNVFIDCEVALHIDGRGLGWAKKYFDGRYPVLFERLEAVNYTQPPYATRYPELVELPNDEPAVPKYNVVERNISLCKSWIRWLDGVDEKIVTVRNNLVDVDPHFFDRENANFRLRADSPALELGFQPLPLHRIGPKGAHQP